MQQQPRNYYELLGVSENAQDAEIRRAFRTLAKSHHPDIVAPQDREVFEASFRDISEAYEILKDIEKRNAYDEQLAEARDVAPPAAVRGRSKAFGIGLAAGLAATVFVIFLKFYLDRSPPELHVLKNQDQLVAVQQPNAKATSDAPQDVPGTGIASARNDQANIPQDALKTTDPVQNGVAALEAPKPEQAAQSAPLETAAVDSKKTGDTSPNDLNTLLAGGSIPVVDTPPVGVSGSSGVNGANAETPFPENVKNDGSRQDPPRSAPEVAGLETPASGYRASQSDAMIDPNANVPAKRRPALSDAVLKLEIAMDRSDDRLAAYRLVSLISSARSQDDLTYTATVARKIETRDLIARRLKELGPVNPVSGERDAAPAYSPPAKLAREATDASMPPFYRPPGDFREPAGDAPMPNIEFRPRLGTGLSESFSDCKGCPVMVAVPGGQFPGSANAELPQRDRDAKRAQDIVPFAVSRFEISIQNWRDCANSGGCGPGRLYWLLARPELAATGISWYDAKTYVAWLSAKSGKRYRLLTEAEWDYIARAGAPAPKGNAAHVDINKGYHRINALDILSFRENVRTSQQMVQNPWGVVFSRYRGMEWVEDCWEKPSNYNRGHFRSFRLQGECSYRIIRGIVSSGQGGRLQLMERAREFASLRAPALGFRVALDMTPVPNSTHDLRDASR